MAGPEIQNGSRIAIKFGNPSSTSSKQSRRPSPPSTLGKRQRSHHALNPDSDSDDGDRNHGKHERITTFGGDDDNIPTSRDTRAPLIIEQLPNRDWKSEARAKNRHDAPPSKRSKSGRETEATKEGESADKEEKPLKWGLTLKKTSQGSEQSRQQARNGASLRHEPENGAHSNGGDEEPEPVDSDEEAANILTGKKESNAKKRVIHGEADRVTEDDAFRRDFRGAPDESTLQDYEDMPVEEFGAALLRGMGWDGKDRGPKVKQVKRRANGLGLGAKELKGEEDLGGWSQKGSSKSRPPKLSDYRREEDRRKEKRDERHRDSYKQERERERRDRDRDRDRDREHHGHRHRERHYAR